MTQNNISQLIDELVHSWNANGKAAEVGMRRIEARIALERAIAQQAHAQVAVVQPQSPDLLETLRIAAHALWKANSIPTAKHVQAVLNEAEYAAKGQMNHQCDTDFFSQEEGRWNLDSEPGCSYS